MMARYIVGLVILIGALGAYVYVQGREYTFEFTEPELLEKLSQKLPLERTYLLIFQVVLDNPRLQLTDGSDRVLAGLDVTLNIRIGSEPLPLGGSVDVSGGVRYDDTMGEFYLDDPVIEDLSIQGVPTEYSGRVDNILTKAIAQYYADRPIYTLNESDVKQSAAKLLLKDVTVQDRVLIVTLGV
ncbi:MAG: DUF1439 domain-containing protein [Pseudomonadales bacterium]